MDIDKLFKVPKYPVGGVKRKMPDNPTPEMLKRMRMDIEPDDTAVVGTTNGSHKDKGESRAAAVHDETGEDVSDNFAPGGDADYFAEEDEEGRFFGGGLTAEQKEILNIFDNASGDAQYMEDLSATGIRKLLLKLERTVNKNQEQRSKYPDDPTKFIESEADLDSSIKSLLPLAQVPATAYPELIRSNTVGLLVGLLSHENADIVIDVVEVFHELTDEDAGGEDADEEDSQSNSEALKSLVEALLENSILDLLVENLQRLNEDEESDRQGVFHMLGTFENLLSFNPSLATQLVSKTNFLPWVLGRIQAKRFDENRAYAAEILSILLQDNQNNRQALGKTDGIEVLLKVLSHYRKRDPADADETEFMENVFDSLCSALGEPSNKELFIQAEGPDLMVLMMKEKLQSCSRAIKTLDFAMSGSSGTRSCEAFIEALGLKTLFSIFMGKGAKKKNSTSVLPASEDTSHILGIISSLFSNIASETPERIRLLAKFVENGYEKVDRLLEIRDNARTRLRATEKQIEAQKKELIEAGEETDPEEEASWYLQRLEGGLYTLQSVDYVLGWVAMEDDGIRAHLSKMMDRKNQSLRDIVQTLKIYMENMDEEGSGDGSSQTVILQGLIEALNVN
ncbi:hypothetical protein E1B28_004310 [Marasmius oreades]|uniref:Beta-catenin-like protein 1 N-terminal domain-containing protein n=1 Tax=Marasmius oreades TaxID=181124 RepID=A0A9P7UYF4_9AGAR|nr:uncharacterized protein E1B28_004310 [Marasmius oreades]KAG7096905.1 hypothetical protein E1B28_004310 [Marasmius oreades]